MEHYLKLLLFGELGVVLVVLFHIAEAFKRQETRRPTFTYYWLTFAIYTIVSAVIIYFLNSGDSLKTFLGLKSGNLTEAYCFFSIGLSISSICKNLIKISVN